MNRNIIDILVADDNDDDVLMIRKTFERSKLMNIVAAVSDGDEAMAYLRRQGKYKDAAPPGLLLLDIKMPKMDGFETLAAIKADPALKRLPVVMLTTSRQEEDVCKSYAAGACSFISKPVKFAQFQEIVNQFALYWAVVATIPRASSGWPP